MQGGGSTSSARGYREGWSCAPKGQQWLAAAASGAPQQAVCIIPACLFACILLWLLMTVCDLLGAGMTVAAICCPWSAVLCPARTEAAC